MKFFSTHRWMALLLTGLMASGQAASENSQSGRNLNPYHEQQLQSQITACAKGVLACSDAETRCLKQQELCQLLIRAERYDEALQVAHNIYQTESANVERCAAHHFMLAEVYNRKMQASATTVEMEKNRQYALSAAQEVVEKKYPAKWGVSEHARALIRDLNDSKTLTHVRQRVASRQGTGDSAKEAIANAQRKYLDATQGQSGRSATGSKPAANFVRVVPEPKVEPPVKALSSTDRRKTLPSSPVITRSVTAEQVKTGQKIVGETRLSGSGLLTSQPGTPAALGTATERQPVLVNGSAAQGATVDAVMQNNLAQLLESARKRKETSRRSPYATGELPSASR